MPQCVRWRGGPDPGQAGMQADGRNSIRQPGTGFSEVWRATFANVFPGNQGGLSKEYPMRDCEIDLSCRRRMARVSFGQFGPLTFYEGELDEENSDRKCVCVALIGAATLARRLRQEKKDSSAPTKIVHFGDLKWTPIIKGCDLAAVAGDPNAEGAPFVVRLRCVDEPDSGALASHG